METTKCVDCGQSGRIEKMRGNQDGAGYLCARCHERRADEDRTIAACRACLTCWLTAQEYQAWDAWEWETNLVALAARIFA